MLTKVSRYTLVPLRWKGDDNPPLPIPVKVIALPFQLSATLQIGLSQTVEPFYHLRALKRLSDS